MLDVEDVTDTAELSWDATSKECTSCPNRHTVNRNNQVIVIASRSYAKLGQRNAIAMDNICTLAITMLKDPETWLEQGWTSITKSMDNPIVVTIKGDIWEEATMRILPRRRIRVDLLETEDLDDIEELISARRKLISELVMFSPAILKLKLSSNRV